MNKPTVNAGAVLGPLPSGSGPMRVTRSRLGVPISLFCVAVAALGGCDKRQPALAPVPVMVKVLAPEKVSVSRRYGHNFHAVVWVPAAQAGRSAARATAA